MHAAAFIRDVFVCINCGVTLHTFPCILHVYTSPHPAFYTCPMSNVLNADVDADFNASSNPNTNCNGIMPTITLSLILNLTLPVTSADNLLNIYLHFACSTTVSAYRHFTEDLWFRLELCVSGWHGGTMNMSLHEQLSSRRFGSCFGSTV